jgi:hypothetical protein
MMQNKSASWWSRGLTVYDKVFADKKHIKHTHTHTNKPGLGQLQDQGNQLQLLENTRLWLY